MAAGERVTWRQANGDMATGERVCPWDIRSSCLLVLLMEISMYAATK